MSDDDPEVGQAPWPAQLVPGHRHVATFDYRDEEGHLVKQVARFEPMAPTDDGPRQKTFRPRWWHAGEWAYREPRGARSVVYRLPELRAYLEEESREGDVWWCEGEKDCEAARALGLTATTLGSASAKIPPDLATQLHGTARLLVVPDRDDPGRRGAERVAVELDGPITDLRIVELPEVGDGGDLSDYLARGRGRDDLWRLAEAAEPWHPPPAVDRTNEQRSDAKSACDRVLAFADELISEGSLELFKDSQDEAFFTLRPPRFRGVLTFQLDSKGARDQLLGAFYGASPGKWRAVPEQAWADARHTLVVRARYGDTEQEVYRRVACLCDRVVLDLGDPNGRAVEVDGSGWRVVDAPTVAFRRSPHMKALPLPTRDGDPSLLRRHLGVSEETYPLVLAWLVVALSGRGPYPILIFSSEQGSGKTTLARVCCELTDPARGELRAPSREERELAVYADNAHVLSFDNLSRATGWFADALCRISSGEGAFATRALYSNREEVVFAGEHPVLLTAITVPTAAADLLDRAYVVSPLPIAACERRERQLLERQFDEDRAGMLGVLLDALSHALGNPLPAGAGSLPRMADAARLAIAAEARLGLAPGSMQAALDATQEAAHVAVLESSPFVEAAIDLVRARTDPWIGTLGELLEDARPTRPREPIGWPSNPRGARAQLERLAPVIRAAGVDVEFLGPSGRSRSRLVQLTASPGAERASAAPGHRPRPA